MGYWSFIRPTGTTNYVRNPSFEDSASDEWVNYVTGGAVGTRGRESAFQKFGAWALALRKTVGADADRWGQSTTLSITSTLNQDYVASAWVNIRTAGSVTLSIQKNAGVGVFQAVIETLTATASGWVRIETEPLTANATGDPLVVFVWIEGTPNVTAYVDAVQIELLSEATTYCDGDQLGCEWLGAENGSNSQRSAESRAGGIVVDFDDMSFDIQGMIGAGMTPITLNVDSYAILPGGELNSQKTQVRPFSLSGWIKGTSLPDLHAKRQAIIDELKPNAVAGDQPVILRYTGATVTKEISAYYETGLEGRIRGDFVCLEQNVALRFLATDPDFYEIGESAAILDSNGVGPNRRNVAGRLRSIGQWDTLGPPNVAGTYNQVNDIVLGLDQHVFFGGAFVNFDNNANSDYIVEYDQTTATYTPLGGVPLNNNVFSMALAPNGDLYVVGAFQNAGGVANADFVAFWDGAAWNAVGIPNGAGAAITAIYDLAFDSSGNLYVVGFFLDLASAGPANNLDYIAMWDGAAWNAVGIPLAGAAVIGLARAVAIDSLDNVYVGGNFTDWANVTDADMIAVWDGSTWAALIALNGTVFDIAIAQDDTAYFAGGFTDAGGDANADYIASWNRQAVSALSTGLDAQGSMLRIAPDGSLYVVGNFTLAGGIAVSGIAAWNGASFAHLDVTHVTGNMSAIAFGQADPVVASNYDIWVGLSTSGTLNYAGLLALGKVDNEGTEEAFPRFKVRRSGGTSATLYSIRNETTGKVLLFAYSLLDGEELTIDLSPTHKSIESNFWGPRPDALLPNSDFGEWALRPDPNDITCFVDIVGFAVITVEMIWRESYWSQD